MAFDIISVLCVDPSVYFQDVSINCYSPFFLFQTQDVPQHQWIHAYLRSCAWLPSFQSVSKAPSGCALFSSYFIPFEG
jgi:hypothetical protein